MWIDAATNYRAVVISGDDEAIGALLHDLDVDWLLGHQISKLASRIFTIHPHALGGWYSVMRKAFVASAVVVLIGGSASYAWLGGTKEQANEAPKVETARLFAPPNDVSPTPASDLIATKLATIPVIWPEVPKPPVAEVQRKPVSAANPKNKKQAQKPKKPPTVTGSL